MKEILFTFFILIFTFISFAQELNKLGKIEVRKIPTSPEFHIEKVDGEYKITKDSLFFEGNTFCEIPNGFISSLEVYDNEKDYIKHFNAQGKLLVTILSDRIINLKISKDGKGLAFFNSQDIIHINLNNYHIDTLQGTFIYSFIGDNDLIYFNSETKNIVYNGSLISIVDYPVQFVEFKSRILVITKKNVFELIGNSLYSRYEFSGSFFDAKIIDEEFYFVDKTEKRKSESVSMYKTSDFSKFILVDRIDEFNR